jgi:hypothetical protein
MIDLHERPDVLRDAGCDASQLRILGVGLGMLASAIPRERVTEVTFSPLVGSMSLQLQGPPDYRSWDDRPLDLDRVRASVVHGTGVLHTDADASFMVRAGRISKVTLHGRWMAPFADLNTLTKFEAAFGCPELRFRLDANGDVIGYDCYYAPSCKWVRWLRFCARPGFVMFGGDSDALRLGDRGGGISYSDA